MDRSSFPLLPLSLVVESSSSSPRRRALARAVDTAHTHTPIPTHARSVGRSVGRGRARSWADDAGCVSSRDASIDPSIDRTDRTIGARAGRDGTGRDGGARAGGCPNVRSVCRSDV